MYTKVLVVKTQESAECELVVSEKIFAAIKKVFDNRHMHVTADDVRQALIFAANYSKHRQGDDMSRLETLAVDALAGVIVGSEISEDL